MSYRKLLFRFSGFCFLALTAFLLAAGPSFAQAEYWLCAQEFNMAMPDGSQVPMWGFAGDDNSDLSDGCPGPATVPGPKLTVPWDESTLTIHLRNDLSGPGAEPVSVIIPGQAMPDGSVPEFFQAGQFQGRVFSLTQSTPADGTTVVTYTWSNLAPGSYLYQSGTHMQVQVQMGLYGAVAKESAAGVAYPGVPFAQETDLFFSEVDPALHTSVNDGTFSGSTLNYLPKYFLLSSYGGGISHDASIDTGSILPGMCINAGTGQGDRLLLRLYNAGLRELAPMLLGSHFDLVAEGGKPYPFSRTQYQTLLMPGSTKDAVFTPGYEGVFKLIDRRLNLTDATTTGGGMQTCIAVGIAPNDAPVVAITDPADGASFDVGDAVNFAGTANDTEDGDISASLSWTSNLDGAIGSGASFSTTPTVGVHTITASVTDSGGLPGSDSISVEILAVQANPIRNVTAVYDSALDQLLVEFTFRSRADSPVLTVRLDEDGDGTYDQTLGTASSPGRPGRYQLEVQPFPDPNPTAASVVRVTSNAGESATAPVVIN